MPDCPSPCQSGTGMKKNADAWTSVFPEEGERVRYRNAPVEDWEVGFRNADVGGISLDTDAHFAQPWTLISVWIMQ